MILGASSTFLGTIFPFLVDRGTGATRHRGSGGTGATRQRVLRGTGDTRQRVQRGTGDTRHCLDCECLTFLTWSGRTENENQNAFRVDLKRVLFCVRNHTERRAGDTSEVQRGALETRRRSDCERLTFRKWSGQSSTRGVDLAANVSADRPRALWDVEELCEAE